MKTYGDQDRERNVYGENSVSRGIGQGFGGCLGVLLAMIFVVFLLMASCGMFAAHVAS